MNHSHLFLELPESGVRSGSNGNISDDIGLVWALDDSPSPELTNLSAWGEELEFDTPPFIFDNLMVRVTLITLYSIVFFFCFFGNLAVVLVMALHWRMRNIAKFCMGHLAFANLCVGIFCIYQNLSMYLFNRWIFGELMCKVYHFTNSLCYTASILILVVVSVERYLVIAHPFKGRITLTVQRLRMILLSVWLISGLICSPRLYYITTVKMPFRLDEESESSAEEDMELLEICVPVSDLYDSLFADIAQFVLTFLVPLVTISILHVKVGLLLRAREKSQNDRLAFVNLPSRAGTPRDNNPSRSQHIDCCRGAGSSSSDKDSTLSFQVNKSQCVQPERSNAEVHVSRCSLEQVFPIVSSSVIQGGPGPAKDLKKKSPKQISSSERVGKSSSSNGYVTGEPVSLLRINFPRGKRSVGDNLEGGGGGVSLRSSDVKITSIKYTHRAVVRTLSAVVLTFAVCNAPFYVRKLYQRYSLSLQLGSSGLSQLVAPLTFLLMYANCAVSPLLYGFLSKSFRVCFLDVIKCKFRRERCPRPRASF